MEGRGVEREAADLSVVENADIRAHRFRRGPGRGVLVQRLEIRWRGGLARKHRIIAVVAALVHGREDARALIGADLPGAHAADVERATFIALRETPRRTPDESTGETAVSVAGL